MHFKHANTLLSSLPADKYNAVGARDLAKKYFKVEIPDRAQMRQIYRYLEELVAEGSVAKYQPPDPEEVKGKRKKKKTFFYLQQGSAVSSLMHESMALQVMLSADILNRSLGDLPGLDSFSSEEVARQVLAKAGRDMQHLRDCLKVLPDGIGRTPSVISDQVLQPLLKGVTKQLQVILNFRDDTRREVSKRLTVRGIVSKDGTLYMIGTTGDARTARIYALQRVDSVEVTNKPANVWEFDINRFVDENLLHGSPLPAAAFPLQPNCQQRIEHRSAERPKPEIDIQDLRIRVAPRALFHFKEHQLGRGQTIEGDAAANLSDANPETWPIVSTRVPYTVQLLPFLLSLGPWVIVDSPPEIRRQMQAVVAATVEHYAAVPSS